MLKFYVFAPNDEALIYKIIDAASTAGAGKIGRYTHCAFIAHGQSTWISLPGSDPVEGEIGEFTKDNEVKIEMECADENIQAVCKAILAVHPYDKVAIDVVSVQRYE